LTSHCSISLSSSRPNKHTTKYKLVTGNLLYLLPPRRLPGGSGGSTSHHRDHPPPPLPRHSPSPNDAARLSLCWRTAAAGSSGVVPEVSKPGALHPWSLMRFQSGGAASCGCISDGSMAPCDVVEVQQPQHHPSSSFGAASALEGSGSCGAATLGLPGTGFGQPPASRSEALGV
jgi:hypothetical protein